MWYDIVILGILLIATFRGAIKGFIWQIAGIVTIVLCFIFAESLSVYVEPVLTNLGVGTPLNHWLGMFVIYLGLSLVVFVIARTLKNIIEKIRLVEYDKHLGALFGLVKGVVLCLVLTFFIVTLSPDAHAAIRGSISGNAAALVMDRLHPVLPERVHEALEPYIHRLDHPELDLMHSHGEVGSHHEGDAHEAADSHGHQADVPDEGKEKIASTPSAPDPNKILRSIAEIYTDSTPAQDVIVDEVGSILNGIPDGVVSAVLSDWHADLTKSTPDPDPSTNESSSLDQRISRQLIALGVDLETLSNAIQSRFRGAERQ